MVYRYFNQVVNANCCFCGLCLGRYYAIKVDSEAIRGGDDFFVAGEGNFEILLAKTLYIIEGLIISTYSPSRYLTRSRTNYLSIIYPRLRHATSHPASLYYITSYPVTSCQNL